MVPLLNCGLVRSALPWDQYCLSLHIGTYFQGTFHRPALFEWHGRNRTRSNCCTGKD